MRSGRLLAEESPQNLLTTYRCKNLEDVFLQLSRKQGATNNAVNELNISNLTLSGLAFGNKKDAPVYISQDSGVVGLNFHQSKEVLVSDHNGSAMSVSDKLLHFFHIFRCFVFDVIVCPLIHSFISNTHTHFKFRRKKNQYNFLKPECLPHPCVFHSFIGRFVCCLFVYFICYYLCLLQTTKSQEKIIIIIVFA